MIRTSIYFLFAVIFLSACRQADQTPKTDFQVKVRLSTDPGRINPMFASASADAREVYPFIFLQLGEYNPLTLKMEPILAEEMPVITSISEGDWAGGSKMQFEILEEAVWEDGQPITGNDFLFTMKMVKNPFVNSARWRSFLQDVVDIDIDAENPKDFSVTMREEYLLAVELVMSCEILPQHIYDPEGIMSEISLSELMDESLFQSKYGQDSILQEFSEVFNSLEYNIEKCSGAGPYNLVEWEPNQYILLRRKENWWGTQFPDRPFLAANPNEILFHIIADETSAITQLKGGGVDVMTILNAENFQNLLESDAATGQFNFHTPQLPQYYYLCLNNRHDILKEKSVRKALAYLVNVDNIIKTLETGEARKIVGAIPRFSPAYHTGLTPVEYNIDLARQLLSEAGWSDKDGDGFLEKTIDGRNTVLDLRIFVTQSELGKRISLLMKEDAVKVGINIEIVQKDFRTYYQENIEKGDFEIAALSLRQPLSAYDPYPRWHSDNAYLGGANLSGYQNPRVDEIIEEIQDSANEQESLHLYKELQEIMYEDQPVIFLYSPVARIVVNNRFDPLISVKRPGYFPNLFELAEKEVISKR